MSRAASPDEPAPPSARLLQLREAAPRPREPRVFNQRRAQETYAALLRAATQVFQDVGFEAAQSTDIALAAKVSVGTFYRYFSDKRQAFIEVIQQHLDEMDERVIARLTAELFGAGRGPENRAAAVEVTLKVLFEQAARHPALQRVFFAMSLRDPEVAQIRAAFEQRTRSALTLIIREIVPEDRVPDAAAAAAVIQAAAEGVAFSLACEASEAQSAALREALGTMITRYLFAEAK
ncbi:MAG: TetR/AcrR family transcriptional regulator [Polyangiaceae bacterium]|nr:TetR/AcrR family transcriptional regulator [Polyangiaceae bacterium]MCW5790050.1 TetR/AcrR family transcriptional regulator [Polyangiaceae bacterium]